MKYFLNTDFFKWMVSKFLKFSSIIILYTDYTDYQYFHCKLIIIQFIHIVSCLNLIERREEKY
jgi:hypothetical protein